MNQKEQIEKALDGLVKVGVYLDSISRDDEAVVIMNRVADIRAALTTPQPEASDREIARRIHDAMDVPMGVRGWNEDAAAEVVATLRADERRKAEAEIADERAKVERLRAIIADLIASVPSSDDPRLDYVEIQIDRRTFQEARNIVSDKISQSKES